jgi:DnaK suppressor protein
MKPADTKPADSKSSSGLSAGELSLLREQLKGARAELQERLQREQAVALQSESLVEPTDAAEQTREQDDALVLTVRDRTLLNDIEDALAKLDSGTYGLSEVSGQPIGFRRLQAIPWARVTADEAEAS